MLDDPAVALRKAEENAYEVLRKMPHNITMRAQLGYIQKQLAMLYLDQAAASSGDTKETIENNATNTLNKAEVAFRQVLRDSPDDVSAHNGLGNIHALRGDTDSAIQEYEIATTLAPEYTFAWNDLVGSLAKKYSETRNLRVFQKLMAALSKVFECVAAPEVPAKITTRGAKINVGDEGLGPWRGGEAPVT